MIHLALSQGRHPIRPVYHLPPRSWRLLQVRAQTYKVMLHTKHSWIDMSTPR